MAIPMTGTSAPFSFTIGFDERTSLQVSRHPVEPSRTRAYCSAMTREDEIKGLALWVHQHKGADGPHFIAEQIGRNVIEGEAGGVELWRAVAVQYAELGLAGIEGVGSADIPSGKITLA